MDMETLPKKWLLLDLGLSDYKDAWDLQIRMVEARKDRILKKDVALFLEHAPVFTLGRRGGRTNLKVPEEFLASRGIPIVHVERGGDITYHGPGQLILYPIVDLRAGGLGVLPFVEGLEEVMIRTVGDWGIRAERNSLNRGVWVERSKIGSIGIAVRHSISFHGLALNVNTDLEPFTWIHPCGLQGVRLTSMKSLLGHELPMKEVREKMAYHLQEVFQVTLARSSLEEIEPLLITRNKGAEEKPYE